VGKEGEAGQSRRAGTPLTPTIMDILLPIFILVGRHFFLLKNKIMKGT
jgi:hypothetical protein